MKEAEKFLNNLLKKNDTIVVATSGGPDSMALLRLLISLKDTYNLNIICAHVNHNVRKESEKEKTFVENYAVINKIKFEYMKIKEYKNNKFSEDEARKLRYKFLNEVCLKYKANYLMTAHHGDDLIETILMRITRGSNLKGYKGISKISGNNNYKIVRPLLYTTKEDIIKYLDDNNIEYVIDKSNSDIKYTRNRYRKHLLPFLKSEDKNVHLKFLEYSEELESTYNYINNTLINKYNKIVNNNVIDRKLFLEEDSFIKNKIIEKVIENIQKDNIFNIDKNLLNIMIKYIDSNTKGMINLKDNYVLRISYNKVYIEKVKKSDEYKYVFSNNLVINNRYEFKEVNDSKKKSNYVIRLNSSDIKLPLIIRTRCNGDRILVKNLNGSKKIKDILIDSKMDVLKRDEYPIVCDSDNNVLWIPGIKKSIFDKEISEKYDIIIEYVEVQDEK